MRQGGRQPSYSISADHLHPYFPYGLVRGKGNRSMQLAAAHVHEMKGGPVVCPRGPHSWRVTREPGGRKEDGNQDTVKYDI